MLFTAMTTGVEFLTDLPLPGQTLDSGTAVTSTGRNIDPAGSSTSDPGDRSDSPRQSAPPGLFRQLLTVAGCWMLVVVAYLLCLVIPVLAMVLTIIEAFREQHWVIGGFCTGMLILVVVSLFLPEGAETSREGLDSTGRPVPSDEDPGYHVTP